MASVRTRECHRIGLLGLLIWSSGTYAAALGRIEVQSGLGQPLRAIIPLTGADTAGLAPRCFLARVASFDGAEAITPDIEVMHAGRSSFIQLATLRGLNEPVMKISVWLNCGTRVKRDFEILLDPATTVQYSQAQYPTISDTQVGTGQSSNSSVAAGAEIAPAVSAPAAERVASAPRATVTTSESSSRSKSPGVTKEVRSASPKATPPKVGTPAAVAPRNMLRLSAPDDPEQYAGISMRPPVSDSQEASLAGRVSGNTVEAVGEQTRVTAVASAEENAEQARLVITALQSQLAVLQAEVTALRLETQRMALQNQADNVAMGSMRNAPSSYWIFALGGLVALFLAALVWLLWRFVDMRKSASNYPWNESQDAEPAEHSKARMTELDFTGVDDALASDDPIDLVSDEPGAAAEEESAMARSVTDQKGTVASALSEKSSRIEPNAVNSSAHLTSPAKHLPDIDHVLKAEEISDIMELVEAWMSLNDPVKVLDLLRPFGESEQPQSPLHWIRLLDVHRALGDRENYDALLKRIRHLFNVRLPAWDAELNQVPAKTLADYPHVVDAIAERWHSDEIKPYLEKLIRDNRDGVRDGFELPVYRDILRLLALLDDPSCQREELDPRAKAILFSVTEPKTDTVDTALSPMPGIWPDAEDGAEVQSGLVPRIVETPKRITLPVEHGIVLDVPEMQMHSGGSVGAEYVKSAQNSAPADNIKANAEATDDVASDNLFAPDASSDAPLGAAVEERSLASEKDTIERRSWRFGKSVARSDKSR